MSIKNLASIIGALGVGMSGFAKGRAQFQDNERQKVLAGREDAAYERTQAKLAEDDEVKAGIARTQSDQVVEDVKGYDLTSMGGGDPEKQATVAYQANGQVFPDQGAANIALWGANSKANKDEATAKFLRSKGRTIEAREFEEFVTKARKEGSTELLAGVESGKASVEAVKQGGGKVARKIGKDLAEVFNKTGGNWHVSENTVVEDFITRDPAGREIVTSRILGKDGKPVVDDVRTAALMLLSVKDRLGQQNHETGVYQQGQQIAEVGRHNKAGEMLTANRDAEAARQNARQNSIAQQGINMQGRRLSLEEKSFKSQGPEGQIATIEKVLKTKLSDDDKKRFLGIIPKSSGKGGKGGSDGKGDDGMDKVTEKVITEAHAEWRASNPTATAQQVAEKLVEFEDFIPKARNQMAIKNSINTTLKGAKPGSREYAAAMDQAKRELGVSDEFLVQSGFKLVKPTETTRNPGLDPARRVVAEVGAAAPPPKPRPPAEPFRPSMRTTPEQIAQQEQAAAQQQRAAQAKQITFDISRAQQILASGEGTPQYRQQAAARIALWQKQLAQMQGQ